MNDGRCPNGDDCICDYSSELYLHDNGTEVYVQLPRVEIKSTPIEDVAIREESAPKRMIPRL